MNTFQVIGLILIIAVVVVLAIFGLFLMVANHIKGSGVIDWKDETPDKKS